MATETVNEVDSMDLHTQLSAKLGQLQALMMMTYGEARESIDSMNETLRDNYFWACSDMVGDCIKLTDSIAPAIYKKAA